MRILDKYIFREIFWSFFGVTTVLLLILMSNKFSRFLGEAAAGKLPKETVFELLGYSAIGYLVILIPIGLFIAILLSIGRLYQDSEMASMQACGIGPWQVYRPVLLLAALAALALYWLSMQVAPWASRQVLDIRNEALAQIQLTQLEPGKFLTADDGNVVFYAEGINSDAELENIFLQQSRQSSSGTSGAKEQASIVTAKLGYQLETERDGQKVFILRDGTRYQGVPGQSDYEQVNFKEYGLPIREEAKQSIVYGVEELEFSALDTSLSSHLAEWQWRWSVPISVLLLAFLAVPMSKTNPRQGRYGKVAIAILLYIVYSNLLALSKAWLEKGEINSELGLWWVHMLLFGIAILLLWQQYGIAGLFGRNEKDNDREAVHT